MKVLLVVRASARSTTPRNSTMYRQAKAWTTNSPLECGRRAFDFWTARFSIALSSETEQPHEPRSLHFVPGPGELRTLALFTGACSADRLKRGGARSCERSLPHGKLSAVGPQLLHGHKWIAFR